ncbi:MAG: malate dehydrogenase [Armatimonadetes bacterium]|nr:malate dehydrogenase [Armatimonadota bacterium]
MYLTNEKVAVLGAAGAIGSNLVQSLLSSGTANHIALYDPFEAGLEGAAEEIWHCGFQDARIQYTTAIGEALRDASFVISSGGAPRKEGMTREDLLRGNCEIARDLGVNLKQHTPDCKFVVVIFNPADITGLTVLVHSGLPKGRVSTLAALDSTRLQTALSQHFGVLPDQVTGAATYGGHGEKMAVFKGGIKVDGQPLTALLAGEQVNGKGLSAAEWQAIQEHVRNGGARIIKLRGRSSFQSPSQQSIFMLRGYLGQPYELPCGAYCDRDPYHHVMMAMPTHFGADGLEYTMPTGDQEDMAALQDSYEHVAKLRDQVIEMGLLPPVAEWSSVNKHL